MTVSLHVVRLARVSPQLNRQSTTWQRPRRARRVVNTIAQGAKPLLDACEEHANLALHLQRVRIEQQLGGLEAMQDVVRPVGAIAVEQAPPGARQVHVPEELGELVQLDA